jgi:hypothetical protein
MKRHSPLSESDLPPELRQLDQLMRGIRFEPRASLEPEVLGRLRRGEHDLDRGPSSMVGERILRTLGALVVAVALLGAGSWIARPLRTTLVDHCCYDLDGGGKDDDGMVVNLARAGRPAGVMIYEDRLGSKRFRLGDAVRFVGDQVLRVATSPVTRLRALRQCCFDLDGRGIANYGVITLVGSSQVVFASTYKTTPPDSLRGVGP